MPPPIEQTKIFIDTSSLMDGRAYEVLLYHLAPRLKAAQNKLIVLDRVIDELKKHIRHGDEHPTRKQAAKRGLRLLEELARQDLLDRRGEEGDPFPDQLFQLVFTRHMTNYPLTLITQDVSLMVRPRDKWGLGVSDRAVSRLRFFQLKSDPSA